MSSWENDVEALRRRMSQLEANIESFRPRTDSPQSPVSRRRAPPSPSERRFGLLAMDNAPQGMMVLSCGGLIVAANRLAAEPLGYHPAELVGRHIEYVNPDCRPKQWSRCWEDIRRSKTVVWETAQRSRIGELRSIQMTLAHVEFDGEEVACTFLAPAEPHRVDGGLVAPANDPQATPVEALTLAAGFARDFSGLVAAALRQAELVLGKIPADSAIRPNLEEIELSTRRAGELCQEIMAYSGQTRYALRTLDLNELVYEMGEFLETATGVDLHYALHPRTLPFDADVSLIQQALAGVVTNAAESLHDEGGSITVATGTRSFDARFLSRAVGTKLDPGPYIFIEVTDDGVGMTDEVCRRIFDPLASKPAAGRGLKMPAVLGIVRGHRGAIHVDSTVGEGTTICLIFPRSADTPQTFLYDEQHPGDDWQGSGTVLVVDDQTSVRRAASRMLETLGFDVLAATGGAEALRIFEDQHAKICCVLLDLLADNRDGGSLVDALRGVEPQIPIIVASGYSEPELTQRLLIEGVTSFVDKPYRLGELRTKLCRLFRQ